MKHKRSILLSLALILILSFTACGQSTPVEIKLSEKTITLAVGESETVKVKNAEDLKELEFSVKDDSIISVEEVKTGKYEIKALKNGETKIIFSAKKADEEKVTVIVGGAGNGGAGGDIAAPSEDVPTEEPAETQASTAGGTDAGNTNDPNLSAIDQLRVNAEMGTAEDFETQYDAVLGGLVIKKYVGKKSSIIVPSTLGDDNVISIGSDAFSGKSIINYVKLSEGITFIEDDAFYKCRQLLAIDLPDSLTKIEYNAFGHCSQLESLTIPKNVQLVGVCAFSDCTSLKSITLPDSLQEIGGSAFYKCTSLETIKLPRDLRTLGHAAFSGCKALTEIHIPENVKTISSETFSNCHSLANVELPDQLLYIESKAFNDCQSLKTVSLPDSLQALGTNSFSHCSNLEKMSIPDGVLVIPESLFYECQNLKELTIGEHVLALGPEAIYGCGNLRSLELPDSLAWIGTYALGECTGVTITYRGNSYNYSNFEDLYNLTNDVYEWVCFGTFASDNTDFQATMEISQKENEVYPVTFTYNGDVYVGSATPKRNSYDSYHYLVGTATNAEGTECGFEVSEEFNTGNTIHVTCNTSNDQLTAFEGFNRIAK